MSNFGIGLTEGLVNGWSQQKEKQDQIKRSETQQQIDNYLTLARAQDVPDEKRQWALDQATGLMQGKKPGQGKNAPNGITARLAKMLGMAHGGQQGMTENTPNGKPAPGTAGSQPGAGFPQQPQGPAPTGQNPQTGRPSILQGNGAPPREGGQDNNAAPAGADQPPAQPPSYQDQLQKRLEAAQKSGNSFATQRAQKALDDFAEKRELEVGRADAQAEVARIRADAIRDKAEADAVHKKELQDVRDSDAKDRATAIEDLKAQHKKENDDREGKLKRDLQDAEDKARESLKKAVPGKAAGTDKNSAQAKKLSTAIENWHQQQYAALDKQLAEASAKKTMTSGQISQLRKTRTAAIEREYAGKVQRAGGSTSESSGGDDRVKVTAPDGKAGTIPRSQLQTALASGYQQVQ